MVGLPKVLTKILVTGDTLIYKFSLPCAPERYFLDGIAVDVDPNGLVIPPVGIRYRGARLSPTEAVFPTPPALAFLKVYPDGQPSLIILAGGRLHDASSRPCLVPWPSY